MQSNKNYGRILALLYRAPGKQERSPRLLSRAYLYTQLESFYVPVRKKGVRRLGNTFEEGTGQSPGSAREHLPPFLLQWKQGT